MPRKAKKDVINIETTQTAIPILAQKYMLPTSHYDRQRADRVVAFIGALRHTKGEWAGQPFTLLPWQEDIVRTVFGVIGADGFRQFKQCYVTVAKKNGKQLALTTPLPTPTGFTTMGAVSVGDTLFDENGTPCKVIYKNAVDFKEQAYRITFKDGEEFVAGACHEWFGEWSSGGNYKSGVVNTEWLYNRSLSRRGKTRKSLDFRIRVAGSLETPDVELPIIPYLMGYWLGNGHAQKPEITVRTCDIPEVMSRITPFCNVSASWDNVGDSRVFRIEELRKVKLRSFHDKVIPPEYLRASRQQRLFLLQGFMDSDGCISTEKGRGIYCSTERPLAESVSELLWTLGIKNSVTSAVCTQRADWSLPSHVCGRENTGETAYMVKFTAFDDIEVAGLKRKQSRAVPRNIESRTHYRYIESIVPCENPGMQCIQVDSPSHLYLAGRTLVPTHNTMLAAAIALYMLIADGEKGAEIYSCAADRAQATLVYRDAAVCARENAALAKRVKILDSVKRITYAAADSFYQVLSSEAYSAHGINPSAVLFDETHVADREMFRVMTHGSSDARRQPLHLFISTAGNDTNSVGYELHQKALDIQAGRKTDASFLPVIYQLDEGDDWTNPLCWAKANPSLGSTINVEGMKRACESARQNPAEENSFKQLRCNMWVKQSIRWMPMEVWDKNAFPVDAAKLRGRTCYGGLDLSSTNDLTAFVLVFPPLPDEKEGRYIVLPFFWVPEETLDQRVKRDHVNYDLWLKQEFLDVTPGNVIDYGFVEKFITDMSEIYDIREIAFDRWGAVQMSQTLGAAGLTMVQFGQGYASLSPPTKELMRLALSEKLAHGGHPVLRWNMDNIMVRQDAAGNLKPDKEKSTERIDGCVACIMALDRAIRCGVAPKKESVYNQRGLLSVG